MESSMQKTVGKNRIVQMLNSMNELEDEEEKELKKKLRGVPRIFLKEEGENSTIKAMKQIEKAVRIGLGSCKED